MTVDITPIQVREDLVEALELDLVGPSNAHSFAREMLPESPLRWYLTGFLVPLGAPLEQRLDETSTEEIDAGGDGEGTDDAGEPDRGAARRSLLPSSMGLSVLVPAGAQVLEATVSWGDYVEEPVGEERVGYRRQPREERVQISLPSSSDGARRLPDQPVPNSNGLAIAVTVRPVSDLVTGADQLPKGTRSVSVFLVNRRHADEEQPHRAFAFQCQIALASDNPFIARPDLRGSRADSATVDWDERVADLHYRDVFEHAVGHAVSATWQEAAGATCRAGRTTWIPRGEVEHVAPAEIPDVELEMETLGQLVDGAQAAQKLMPLVSHYRRWLADQSAILNSLSSSRAETAKDLLTLAQQAGNRIEAGIKALSDPQVLEAFRVANRAMARSARQRAWIDSDGSKAPEQMDRPRWRPFQLAFLLLTLHGIADPTHADRGVVDLLFFPTGGGKTEAYLGLAAFTIVLRRLRQPGVAGCGMSVLMRYTLRLLTLDQLGRAAALMCALELERKQAKSVLGEWPFEIGLWVGQGATPNRMGRRGDTGPGREYTAYTKTRHFQQDDVRNPAPIPIENCPWCGTKFKKHCFRLVPSEINPIDLRVHCASERCLFSGDRVLPILAVDEPIYRRLPAFLIATVDKFAALPWTGETGALFGRVERYDEQGFYGPSQPGQGRPLDGPLPPPDLVIQDELHLISGPLGTIAGVYEVAIDALTSHMVGTSQIRAKIIASTATVRRADSQIRALFGRQRVEVFPPPGPTRGESFFARTCRSTEVPARKYVGVAAQGRSAKVVLLRAALALLSAAQTAHLKAGGKRNKSNSVDPYMTLLGYFNSLRELGGSRRIVEDEVRTRLAKYSLRRRLDPQDHLFADRSIGYDVMELTSRVSTNKVADAKRRLALPFHEDDRVDVALATNMISVGLDIIRLGLMVVLGQPKASAEYIQATSRVGRDPQRPGLVVTLLNVHKPRDRSHYERFEAYHRSFYRSVEATSVTPFSPRALDRALPAALVALCRHELADMTPPTGASNILERRAALGDQALKFADRAQNHSSQLSHEEASRLRDQVLERAESLLDDWVNIAREFRSKSVVLQYQKEAGGAQRLLYEFLHPDLPQLPAVRRRFRANRSMRDVERNVEMTVKNLQEWGERK